MNILKIIFSNGYIPLIPILLWNLIFAGQLPGAYDPRTFNSNLPSWLLLGENVFRTILFILPLFIQIDVTTQSGKQGLVLFVAGTLLYFASWLLLIYAPESAWSQSSLGFAAPAYTPLIWLLGLGLMFDSYYFGPAYSKWQYLVPALAFLCCHVSHAALAFIRFKA